MWLSQWLPQYLAKLSEYSVKYRIFGKNRIFVIKRKPAFSSEYFRTNNLTNVRTKASSETVYVWSLPYYKVSSWRMPWFDDFCRGFIREGHSLMAIDSEENELVGLSITHACRRKFGNPAWFIDVDNFWQKQKASLNFKLNRTTANKNKTFNGGQKCRKSSERCWHF